LNLLSEKQWSVTSDQQANSKAKFERGQGAKKPLKQAQNEQERGTTAGADKLRIHKNAKTGAMRRVLGLETQNASRTLAFQIQIGFWGDSGDPCEPHKSKLQEKYLHEFAKSVNSFLMYRKIIQGRNFLNVEN